MHLRKAFGLALVAALTAGTSRARGADEKADEKEACLSAADQGQSLRDDGKYMVARDQFLSCAREVCPKLVHDQCTEWLRQLDEATPTVVFGAKDGHGNDVTAARVLSDGVLVTSNLDGKPLPLDPGPHDIRFERDPNESVTVHLVLRAGEKNREVTATFPAAEGSIIGSPGDAVAAPPAAEAPGPARFWSGRTTVSLTLLAAGAVAAGAGAYFGLQSQNEKKTGDGIATGQLASSSSACVAPSGAVAQTCAQLSSARNAQNTDAILNEALYIAGGALAVGALATWLLWPAAHTEPRAGTAWVAPVVGPSQAGLAAGGAF